MTFFRLCKTFQFVIRLTLNSADRKHTETNHDAMLEVFLFRIYIIRICISLSARVRDLQRDANNSQNNNTLHKFAYLFLLHWSTGTHANERKFFLIPDSNKFSRELWFITLKSCRLSSTMQIHIFQLLEHHSQFADSSAPVSSIKCVWWDGWKSERGWEICKHFHRCCWHCHWAWRKDRRSLLPKRTTNWMNWKTSQQKSSKFLAKLFSSSLD